MKKIFIIVLLLVIGYFIYDHFYNVSPFEIRDKLTVSQLSGLDINTASPTPPPKYASIEGFVKNKSKKVLSNISIIYLIGYDTIVAGINFIIPGDSAQFKTTSCRVRSANSKYDLIDIKFDETGN